MDIEEGKRMGFKDLFKQRIAINILSGGHVLTDKHIPTPIQIANITKGNKRGEIIAEIPFAGKKAFTLKGIEWEESHTRSGGKAAAGAIIGSIVGPVGTVAGAAIGGKKKDTSKAYLILVDQEGNEHQVHIHCDQNLYIQLAGLLS
jgi:hypothetical protein